MRFLMMKIREGKIGEMPLAAGYYLSEKLDGIRVLWDGGVTLGLPKADVPWANTEKDARYRDEQICTGLWTQLGHVIHAPRWFTDTLPNAVVEGELYAGRGNWQVVSSAVKKLQPIDSEWQNVGFTACDIPPIDLLFADGKVRFGPKQDHIIRGGLKFFYRFGGEDVKTSERDWSYNTRRLRRNNWCEHCCPVIKERMIYSDIGLVDHLATLVKQGGEGIVLKCQENRWHTDRAKDVFKLKPEHDAECIVLDWTPGKGKYTGMMGNLVCKTIGDKDLGLQDNVLLELSGFTDAERSLTRDHLWPLHFKRGDVITFKYRELSDNGVPKEGRYDRVRMG